MSADSLIADTCVGFAARYGRPPQWLAIAPGRVNLIGDHTDYNGGFALPFAIQRHVVLAGAAAPESDEPRIVAYSTGMDSDVQIELGNESIPKIEGWGAYLAGVTQGARSADVTVNSMDLYIGSDLPSGAGLSSSAALSVAFLTLLEEAAGARIDAARKIEITQTAEHEYANVPCGVLDMYTIIHAREDHLMLLDCATLSAQQIAWSGEDIALLVVDSGVKHSNAESAYSARRAECEKATSELGHALGELQVEDLPDISDRLKPSLYARVRHVVSENQRVKDTADAISRKDWERAGELLYASHKSLAEDFEVSCDETDLLVGIAGRLGPANGVYGARMTGGGFGGCVVMLCEAVKLPNIKKVIAEHYLSRSGIRAGALRVSPAQGAHIV